MKYKIAREIIRMITRNGMCWAITAKYRAVTRGMKLYHKDLRIFEIDDNKVGKWVMDIPFYFGYKEDR